MVLKVHFNGTIKANHNSVVLMVRSENGNVCVKSGGRSIEVKRKRTIRIRLAYSTAEESKFVGSWMARLTRKSEKMVHHPYLGKVNSDPFGIHKRQTLVVEGNPRGWNEEMRDLQFRSAC